MDSPEIHISTIIDISAVFCLQKIKKERGRERALSICRYPRYFF
jgi:hypothetical protein